MKADTVYCTRCSAAEWLHHKPNIYSRRSDFPAVCDEFTPPKNAEPARSDSQPAPQSDPRGDHHE